MGAGRASPAENGWSTIRVIEIVNFPRPQLCCSVAAVVATAACGSGTGTPVSPTIDPPVGGRIVVLGDSLAVSPSRSQNFVTELQGRLNAAHPGWSVINAGVSGDTTAGGVRRVDAVISTEPHILVLELGANDGLRGVPIATVEQNLSTIIERAQGRGVRVLLCGMETPPLNGWNYSVEFHRVFPRLAARHRVPLVPFLLDGVALNPDLNGADTIHPNAAGARAIAATVWPYLQPLVAAPVSR
jgi:acyl-CoA thioesterase I